MAKNWITTVGGVLLFLGGAVQTMGLPEGWQWVGPALLSIGGLIVGAGAKQYNVHSTEKEVKAATKEVKEEIVAEKKEKLL